MDSKAKALSDGSCAWGNEVYDLGAYPGLFAIEKSHMNQRFRSILPSKFWDPETLRDAGNALGYSIKNSDNISRLYARINVRMKLDVPLPKYLKFEWHSAM